MEVYLKEWNDNEMEDAEVPISTEEPNLMEAHIEGPAICYPYDTNLNFSIVGISSGEFVVNSNKVKIVQMSDNSCVLEILSGKSFEFDLAFVGSEGTNLIKHIRVLPM